MSGPGNRLRRHFIVLWRGRSGGVRAPRAFLTAVLAMFLVTTTFSAPSAGEGPPPINPDVLNGGFLDSHQDLYGQIMGLHAFEKGDYREAMRLFRLAARHGDKASQAMIADMYWDGLGVEQDRALGYAWMDLAAERRYPQFVHFRERYWNALDDAGRREAIERGQAVYAEYRDSVAKPRLDRLLRRARAVQTGTRTGSATVSAWIGLQPPAMNGVTLVKASEYYAKKYWEPEQYWELQDRHWQAPPRGQASVGELESVDTTP